MVDIDLMNKPGLQKIISKVSLDSSAKKHDLLFGNLDLTQNQKSSIYSDSSLESSETSAFSLALAMIILSVFIALGIFKFNEDFKYPNFSSYFKTADISNIEIAKSLIIGFLSNSHKIEYLNSINLDEDLVINININKISDLNLKSRQLQFFNIIENKEFYNASFNIPLNEHKLDVDIETILLELLNEYENRLDVFLKADGEAIHFTSNGKIIYEILEKLIFINPINITKNSNNLFTLRFPY